MILLTNRLLLMLLIVSSVFAFDNEIKISGSVFQNISVDIFNLSKDKDTVYLSTNCRIGAEIIVKELGSDDNSKKNILNNGVEYTLPMTYQLFNDSSFLGTSPIPLDGITLGIDVRAH